MAVWDTSAIIEIRQQVSRARRGNVLKQLYTRAELGTLLIPHQVLEELERFRTDSGRPDELAVWARRCEKVGACLRPRLELVKYVLKEAPTLIDPNTQFEEADPYVLALALEKADTGDKTVVVTNDFKDRTTKLSLSSACGLVGIVSVPCLPHLRRDGIIGDS